MERGAPPPVLHLNLNVYVFPPSFGLYECSRYPEPDSRATFPSFLSSAFVFSFLALGSESRTTGLAGQYGLSPPKRGQVVCKIPRPTRRPTYKPARNCPACKSRRSKSLTHKRRPRGATASGPRFPSTRPLPCSS